MPKYIKLEDALNLLPTDDVCGPKPTRLRKELQELPYIEIEDKEDEQ